MTGNLAFSKLNGFCSIQKRGQRRQQSVKCCGTVDSIVKTEHEIGRKFGHSSEIGDTCFGIKHPHSKAFIFPSFANFFFGVFFRNTSSSFSVLSGIPTPSVGAIGGHRSIEGSWNWDQMSLTTTTSTTTTTTTTTMTTEEQQQLRRR